MEKLKDIKGIKPCPFCANEGEVVKWHEEVYSISCTGRYCTCDIGNSTSIEGIKRRWNKRRYINKKSEK